MSANIEHLRAVGRAATEGPWLAQCATTAAGDQIVTVFTTEDESIYEDRFANLSDAKFIATARNEWDGLLDEVEALRAKVARVEWLASEWEQVSPDDEWHAADCFDEVPGLLRAALADESAQDGLSRAGTTAVASGAAGDVTGAQIGAQDEGGKA